MDVKIDKFECVLLLDLRGQLSTTGAWSEFAYLGFYYSVLMEPDESTYFNLRNHHRLFPFLLEI